MFKFNFFIFLFFILASISAYGNHGDLSDKPTIAVLDDKLCNLPAPTGLAVTNVTTNSITVQWNPVAGAIGYVATAYDVATNTPIPAIPTYPSPTTAVVLPLPPGTLIEVRVAAICENNVVSTIYAAVQAQTDIVIEIIANGYNCPNSPLNSNNQSNGTTPIEIVLGTDHYYNCEITVPNNSASTRFSLNSNSATKTASFGQITTGIGTLSGGGASAALTNGNSSICTFKMLSIETNVVKLKVSGLPNGFTVKTYICSSGFGQEMEVRDDESPKTSTSASISPNPFTDRLQVQFQEEDKEGDARILLFHINGTLLQTKTQALADGNSCELLTETLPAGMYLLRIETPEGSMTRLVTKTGQ